MSARASQLIYLDSEERISGSASNFLYEINIPDGVKVDTCCVLSMTIPRSYYLIRPGQNKAVVILAGTEHPFEIPPGNYNADNFSEILLAILNGIAGGPAAAFTITFSTITGKYTYSYSGVGTAAFVLRDPSRLGHQMGFDEVSENHFVAGTSSRRMWSISCPRAHSSCTVIWSTIPPQSCRRFMQTIPFPFRTWSTTAGCRACTRRK